MSRIHKIDALLRTVMVGAMIALPGRLFAADCYTAVVAFSFALPDGSEQPPGTLKLCVRGPELLHIYVNGHPAGMFWGRIDRSEGVPKENQAVLVFRRNGRLGRELEGCAIPDGSRYRAIHFADSPEWLQALGRPPNGRREGGFVRLTAK